MNVHLLLGFIYIFNCVYAQQYGPVPPRPQQFAGATLVQQSRQNFRQRPISPRVIPETIQPVEQLQVNNYRRPQPLRKVKAQVPQQQILDQQRTNLIEDVPAPFTAKITIPTPLPQTQPQPAKLTPRPVEENINEEEEVPTTIVTTPSTTTYAIPLRTGYAPAPAPAQIQPSQIPNGFQGPQFLQPTAFRAPPVQQPIQQPVQQSIQQPIQQPVQQSIQQPIQQPVQFNRAALQGRQFIRQQQVRPVQQVQVPAGRPQIQQVVPQQIPEAAPDDEQYFRQISTRPLKKQEPVRQQVIEREPQVRQQLAGQPQIIRQQPVRTQAEYTRPAQREPHVKAPQRERKPVAQTIRKYHEEHEDGSITWGYENDDGSFKEETIGVDCVTRGKYGYFDPDGVKREYTYQTGIPCDKTQEAEEAASNQGFIDYTNNKYVLPNGDEIDLEAMVKNRARKPVPQYRN